ncbi:MAG: DUF4058 family protein, partial [Gemmataceae bacterium]
EPSLWPDFHMALLVVIRMALNPILPSRYAAYLDRHVYLEDTDEDRNWGGAPDLYLADKGGEGGAAAAVLTAPASATVILPAVRRLGNRYLRIIDRNSRRIVTLIELLSPSNKSGGRDGDAYLAKRDDFFATGTNLVEIDLLRGGRRPPPAPVQDYRILVSRAADFPRVAVWDIGLREPLPVIPVPLHPEDGAVALALQRCIDQTYDGAPYAHDLDYSVPPDPPLRDADAAWASALLSSRTRQGATP